MGVASYIHVTPGADREIAGVRIEGAGTVTLLSGGQSNGQGHPTTFPQLIADVLGVPVASVVVMQGDTQRIAEGNGTGGSRTLVHGADAMIDAATKVVAQGKAMAAEMLEAAPADIAFDEGDFAIKGTNRRVGLFEVSAHAEHRGEPLAAEGAAAPNRSFPNGCHVCEVEIDPNTGVIEIVRYPVVDDLGTVVNPLLAAGQVHGGTVQGIGKALCEATRFDPRSGQLLSGSFVDYCLPRARDLAQCLHQRRGLPQQPARHQGRGRGRHDRRASGGGQRRPRRAAPPGRRGHRHADDARARVANDPDGGGTLRVTYSPRVSPRGGPLSSTPLPSGSVMYIEGPSPSAP